jgi:hypothetical protein
MTGRRLSGRVTAMLTALALAVFGFATAAPASSAGHSSSAKTVCQLALLLVNRLSRTARR